MASQLNYWNAAAYAANLLVVNGVGAGGVLGTPTNAEISAKFTTIATPAGYAFSIWGLIFLLQLVWATAQLTPKYRESPLVIEGVGRYYIGVCVAQIAWTFAFSFERILLSLVFMVVILYFLLVIVTKQYRLGTTSTRDFWVLKLPFSLHAGWIIAAAVVNVSLVLVKWNVSAQVQFIVAILSLLILLLAVTYFLHLSRPDCVVPLVLVWAMTAIAQELKEPKEVIVNTFTPSNISVVRTGSIVASSVVVAAILARSSVVALKKNHRVTQEDDTLAQPSDRLLSQK